MTSPSETELPRKLSRFVRLLNEPAQSRTTEHEIGLAAIEALPSLTALLAQHREMREFIATAQHAWNCRLINPVTPADGCTCGLSALRASIRGEGNET